MLLLAGLLGLAAVGSIIVFMLVTEKSAVSESSPTAGEPDRALDTDQKTAAVQRVDDVDIIGDMPDITMTEDSHPNGQGTTVMDLDTDEDSLVLVWDDEADQHPEIEVVEDEQNPEMARVLLNGRVLADVKWGRCFTASDIILVPQSTALAASANPTIAALLSPV
ncbi:MAG: hypothetical protein ABJI96_08565 [Paracoccaceae bacterium]